MAAASPAGQTVFVNCPYDAQYQQDLLYPLLFTLLWGGLDPRIASERSDGGEKRIDKICELIADADFCVHDLSRARATVEGEAQRMNMPFELGVAYGYRRFAEPSAIPQRWLVLVGSQEDKAAALSDFAGMDAQEHGDDARTLVRVTRTWIVNTAERPVSSRATTIWKNYLSFNQWFYASLKFEGADDDEIEAVGVKELMKHMREWILSRHPSTSPTRSAPQA